MLGAHGGPRAVPILLDIARSNAELKLRLTAIKRLGDQHNEQVTDELLKIYDADRTKEVRIQILRALVENRSPRGTAKVLEIARAGDDLPIRQYAIRYLGELNDAASLDELIRIYDADKTKEIRVQVLRALAEREDPKARAKVWEVARQGETQGKQTFRSNKAFYAPLLTTKIHVPTPNCSISLAVTIRSNSVALRFAS
jgi:HEAT repeat protein